jgi:hypothetical protein
MNFYKLISIIFSGFIIAACATTTGVLPKGNGIYTINVQQGSQDKVKLRAYQHAEKYCAEKSKNGIKVSSENLRPDPASPNMGIIDLEFSCQGPVDSAFGKKVLERMQKDAK